MGTNHLHPLLSGARQVFLSHSALLSILTFHGVFGKLGFQTGTPLNGDTSRGRPAYPKLPGVRPTMGLLGGCGTGARGSTIPVILWVVRVRCGFLALCLLNGGMVLHLLRHIRLSLPVTVIRCGGYSLRILQRRNGARLLPIKRLHSSQHLLLRLLLRCALTRYRVRPGLLVRSGPLGISRACGTSVTVRVFSRRGCRLGITRGRLLRLPIRISGLSRLSGLRPLGLTALLGGALR